jgi:hypothetical protein
MNFEVKGLPYLNKDQIPVNFSWKRFEFWLENVPSDIRRWEYDLWKCYKILDQIGYRDYVHLKEKGRVVPIPGYSLEIQEKDWQEFRASFLWGNERASRFQEIADQVERDWEKVLEENQVEIPKDEIGIVALEGSGFYGPRKVDASLSDIDIKILLKTKDNSQIFEIMPSIKNTDKPFYHVIGTGETDEGRFHREEIHWLLYPHLPVFNSIGMDELSGLIDSLVISTRGRKDELETKIANLRELIEKRRGELSLK